MKWYEQKKQTISLYLIIAILLLLVILFFWENIFFDKVFYFGDNFNLFIPNKVFFVNQIKKGIFPLWNPLILSGAPYTADLGIFPFYPGNVFFLLFSCAKAITYLAIFQIFLSGLFIYFYLKTLGFDNFLRFLGAITFMFSGSMISHIGNISILNVIIWLPLILLFLEKSFANSGFKYVFITSAIITISFLGGHLQLFYYNLIFIFLYLIFKIKVEVKEKLKKSFLIFLIFLCLSAFQILPFLEYANLSTRPVADFSYSTELSMKPIVLIRFILAEIYGRLRNGYSWGPGAPMERGFADVTGYIGVLPLIFIFITILNKKRKNFVFWITGLFLFIFLSLGKYTPLYYILFKLIPFFSRFRNPPQFLFLYTFCATILSLFGLKEMVEFKKKNIKRIKLLILLSLPLLIFAFFIFTITRSNEKFLFQLMANVYNLITHKTFLIPASYNEEKITVILNLLIRNLTITLFIIEFFLIGIYSFFRQKINLKKLQFLVFLLIFIDLFLFSKNSLFIAQDNVYEIPKEAVTFLKNNLSLDERFLSTSEIIPYTGLFNYWNQTVVRPPFGESRVNDEEMKQFSVLKKETAVLPPDIGMNFELPTINGYVTMVLKDYADYFDPLKKKRNINNITLNNFFDKRINFLGVKYLILDKGLDSSVLKKDQFKLVFSGNFVKIYKNKLAFPRSFIIKNGQAESKTVKQHQPNQVKIELKGNEQGTLVSTDNYYPGWEVYIDGKKGIIRKYRNNFRSVEIYRGTKEVKYIFRPKIFYLGLLISLLTMLLCIINLVWLSVQKLKKE